MAEDAHPGSERAGGGIFIIGATGESVRRITDFGFNPSWSPDANQIAFNDGSAVWVMNADGSGAHIIQDVQTSYSAYPAWSPDGTKILFASPRDGAFTDIYVMNADGSAVVRLTHSPAGVLNEDFDWSPDGTEIAFRTNRDSGNPDMPRGRPMRTGRSYSIAASIIVRKLSSCLRPMLTLPGLILYFARARAQSGYFLSRICPL